MRYRWHIKCFLCGISQEYPQFRFESVAKAVRKQLPQMTRRAPTFEVVHNLQIGGQNTIQQKYIQLNSRYDWTMLTISHDSHRSHFCGPAGFQVHKRGWMFQIWTSWGTSLF
jgi:hypothetical protein